MMQWLFNAKESEKSGYPKYTLHQTLSRVKVVQEYESDSESDVKDTKALLKEKDVLILLARIKACIEELKTTLGELEKISNVTESEIAQAVGTIKTQLEMLDKLKNK
jgi:hypothetical protein